MQAPQLQDESYPQSFILVLYAGHASKKVAIYSSLSGINGTLVIIVIFIGIYTISQTWDLYVSLVNNQAFGKAWRGT